MRGSQSFNRSVFEQLMCARSVPKGTENVLHWVWGFLSVIVAYKLLHCIGDEFQILILL